MPGTDAGATVPGEGATVLLTDHARLDLPSGAVPAGAAVQLVEGGAVPALPPEYQLQFAWRLGGDDGVAPLAFQQAATLRLNVADAIAAHPDGFLQVRQFTARRELWTELPVTIAADRQSLSVPVWTPGNYALVVNTALAPRAPVEAIIGPEGGSVDFARLHLDVPPGALDARTRITVGPPAAPVLGWRGSLPFPFSVTAQRVSDGSAVEQLRLPMRLAVAHTSADIGTQRLAAFRFRRYEAASGQWASLPTAVDAVAERFAAQTDHLSTFTVAGTDDANPFDFGSNWTKADTFSGAASMRLPFELPPGPGGLGPPLALTFDSQSSHWRQRANALSATGGGHGVQSASWVGEGFDVPIGYVQQTTDNNNGQHYSINLFGQSFRLLQDSSGVWHTSDEQFWKVDYGDPATDTSLTYPVQYVWRIIAPDGTKYFFGTTRSGDQTDLMVSYNFSLGSQFANRWMLSRIVDPSQNLVVVSYARLTKQLSCNGVSAAMTPAVYPLQLQYGGQNPNSLPYTVAFNRSGTPPSPLSGSTGTDRVDLNVTDWIDNPCSQDYFDTNALASIDVTVGGSLARRYVFTTNHSGTPLMLQEVDLWSDAAGTQRQRLLTIGYTWPPLQDTNTTADGTQQVTNPYVLANSLANGFGGTTTFGYQFEAVSQFQDYAGVPPGVLFNGRAAVATSRTVDPGFGGAVRRTNVGGYANPLGNNDANWPDFLGHSQVTVTDAASTTTNAYLQGQSPGRLTQQTVQDLATPPNTVQSTTNTWTATHLDPNAGGITWTALSQADVTQQSGQKRTSYQYATASQNGGQYGNRTDTYEYDLTQSSTAWLRHTNRQFFPGVTANHHVVTKLAQETVSSYDPNNPGGPGIAVRQTATCYDGAVAWNTPIGGAGTDGSYRGLATARRKNADLPNTDRYQDITFTFDPNGNRLTKTRWNSYGTASQLANSDGRTTTTAYDATYHAYKVSVTTPPTPNVPGGLVTRYGYDTVHNRLTSVTDPNSQNTTHTYDALGRRLATWLPGDDPGQPGAATVTYRYQLGGGQPTSIQVGRRKDAGGGEFGRRSYTWTCYDGTGKVIQTQADFDRSRVYIRAQDLNDALSAVTADGGTAPFSPVGAETDHILASHFTRLQGAIQSLWTTAGLGTLPPWSSNLTPGGDSVGTAATPIYLSDIVDLRRWLNFYEQSTGKSVHGWSNDAGTVTVVNRVYDARGMLQRQSVPHLLALNLPGQFQAGDWSSTSNPAVTTTYDALRRPLTRVQPDGIATFRWSYNGWATTLVDENGHQKVPTADVLSRLITVQDYTGTYPSASLFQTTSYAYDVADMLTGVTDATGQNHTGRVYDSLGRLQSQADPDLGSWTYQYNPIGTLASLTDAKQQTISYTYDHLDRLAGKSGTGLSVAYNYDEASASNGKGRRTSMADGAGMASYGYDARGRRTSVTRVINGASYPFSTTYDEQDRPLSMTYPNGDVLDYLYGDNGRPTTLYLNGNVVLVNEATYTQLNQLATLPLGNGLTTDYHYYALDVSPPNPNQWFGRLAQVVTGGVQNESLSSYDSVGNPTGLSYTDHTSESFAAAYNEWDQLTAYGSLEGYAYIPGGQQYDIGTLQSKGSGSYAYPAPGQPRPQAPTSVSGVGSLSYDANGNRSGDPTTTYTYDVEDHLTQLTKGGTTVLQNAFDGDGVRLVRTASGVTTHFVGDWYEFNVTGGVATAYYPFGGQAVAMKVDSTVSFLHRDRLDSLVSATDASGNEQGWARYFPFGALRLSGGSLPGDRLFTGQTRDLGDDRCYWFKARAYDSTTGQFQSPDTALPDLKKGSEDAQLLNRYAYALNNPLRTIDPSGHAALVDPGWEGRFAAAHGSQAPSQQDWRDYQFSLSHAGSGPNGTWTGTDWALFTAIQGRVGFGLTGLAWPLVVGGEREVTQALANTAGAATALRNAGLPVRPPDYATVTISFSPPNPITRGWVGVSLQLTKDRFGDWYLSPGVNLGKSPIVTGAVTAGWILDRHAESQQEVESFLSSYSLSIGAFWMVGGFQATWGNLGQMQANATAIEVGFSTGPQFGASVTNTAEVYEQVPQ